MLGAVQVSEESPIAGIETSRSQDLSSQAVLGKPHPQSNMLLKTGKLNLNSTHHNEQGAMWIKMNEIIPFIGVLIGSVRGGIFHGLAPVISVPVALVSFSGDQA